ncbi:MAG: hypothetical protein HY348_07815, partial [Nitrospira defluvii]|nr:hypothetical protein [Nitrospira defluvii]
TSIYFTLIDARNVAYARMVPVSVTVTASGTTPPPPPPIGGAGGTTGSLTITWFQNTEADLAGYRIYIGTASGVYANPISVQGNTTSYAAALSRGFTYFVALTAVDTNGNESEKSAELSRSLY